MMQCRGLYVTGIFCSILLFFSCGAPPSPPAATQPDKEPPAEPSGLHFRFSQLAPPTPEESSVNWCDGPFGEPLVVNAEKENMQRRYFYLPPGVTKLAIGPSGITTAFMLKPVAPEVVEIYTGNNFPLCLSIATNFSPLSGGAVVQYQNHKNVTFSLELKKENGHFLVVVEFPKGANYGMSVNPCAPCK